MKNLKWEILFGSPLLVVTVGVVVLLAMPLLNCSKMPEQSSANTAQKELYQCPMHPQITSDHPGKCPICGMDLVLFKKSEPAPANGQSIPGYATVAINPEKQQLIGVRKGEVKKMPLTKTIRAVGTTGFNERRLRDFNIKFPGWIEEVNNSALAGSFIAKGTPLFNIYSPELVAAQQEFLLALDTSKKAAQANPDAAAFLKASKQRLMAWDMTEAQIEQLAKDNVPPRTTWFTAPMDGFIIEDNLTAGKNIMPGETLFKIVDLSMLWVNAEVYEYELPFLAVDGAAELELAAFPGERFTGKISYIFPNVTPATRTIRVRIELPNKDLKLKSDMYGTVILSIDLGVRLVVPSEAVLDTGTRQIVFVDKENGHFEPREVKLGSQISNYYEVLSGLTEGEKIVTSGNFLIDSESKLEFIRSSAGNAGAGTEHQHGDK